MKTSRGWGYDTCIVRGPLQLVVTYFAQFCALLWLNDKKELIDVWENPFPWDISLLSEATNWPA